MAMSSLNNLAQYSSSEEEEDISLSDSFNLAQSPIRSEVADQADQARELMLPPDLPSTSSSADQLTPSEASSDADDDEIPETTSKRKAYALPLGQLPEQFQTFLLAVKVFFTASVNLQRQRPPVSLSTYAKIQERMLCKSGTPICFLICFNFSLISG